MEKLFRQQTIFLGLKAFATLKMPVTLGTKGESRKWLDNVSLFMRKVFISFLLSFFASSSLSCDKWYPEWNVKKIETRCNRSTLFIPIGTLKWFRLRLFTNSRWNFFLIILLVCAWHVFLIRWFCSNLLEIFSSRRFLNVLKLFNLECLSGRCKLARCWCDDVRQNVSIAYKVKRNFCDAKANEKLLWSHSCSCAMLFWLHSQLKQFCNSNSARVRGRGEGTFAWRTIHI